jgi:hypothetical protein
LGSSQRHCLEQGPSPAVSGFLPLCNRAREHHSANTAYARSEKNADARNGQTLGISPAEPWVTLDELSTTAAERRWGERKKSYCDGTVPSRIRSLIPIRLGIDQIGDNRNRFHSTIRISLCQDCYTRHLSRHNAQEAPGAVRGNAGRWLVSARKQPLRACYRGLVGRGPTPAPPAT